MSGAWLRALIAVARRDAHILGSYKSTFYSRPAGVVFTLVLAVFTLAVAGLAFGVDVRWSTAWIGLPLGLLAALAFAPFALLFCAITLAFKQAPGQSAVLPVLALVSGLYFPVALLPNYI